MHKRGEKYLKYPHTTTMWSLHWITVDQLQSPFYFPVYDWKRPEVQKPLNLREPGHLWEREERPGNTVDSDLATITVCVNLKSRSAALSIWLHTVKVQKSSTSSRLIFSGKYYVRKLEPWRMYWLCDIGKSIATWLSSQSCDKVRQYGHPEDK